MQKKNKRISTPLMLTLALLWFLSVGFITSQTEYQDIIADRIADPQGISTQLEGIIKVVIVVVSFLPSGLLVAYPYILNNFKKHVKLRAVILAIALAAILWVPFAWYNFAVNFSK